MAPYTFAFLNPHLYNKNLKKLDLQLCQYEDGYNSEWIRCCILNVFIFIYFFWFGDKLKLKYVHGLLKLLWDLGTVAIIPGGEFSS